jgi:hypothetical protein
VGILDTAAELLKFGQRNGINLNSVNTGLASSFDSSLKTLVGPTSPAMLDASITNAMTVPAVSRAVQLYTTAAAKLLLKDDAGNAPAWLTKAEGNFTPGDRIARIVIDLIMHGRAVLWVSRDASGAVTDVVLLPAAMFSLDFFGRIMLQNVVLPKQNQFVYIRSLTGVGFLEAGRDTISHYQGLRDSILSRSRNPIPVVELKVKEQFELEDGELDQAQSNWHTARTADNGAVAVTPYGVDAIIHGDKADTAMLDVARNAVRLDVANFLNINASLLDGNNGTSDTYSNTLGNKDEFIDLSLDTFLLPIEQRMSMADVSTGLKFDRSVLAVAAPAVGNTGNAGGAQPIEKGTE